eukprot:366099-Chlamydomonas_euryale.AAC.11
MCDIPSPSPHCRSHPAPLIRPLNHYPFFSTPAAPPPPPLAQLNCSGVRHAAERLCAESVHTSTPLCLLLG